MFGRMGRALLRPFSARQYAQGTSRTWPLSEELKEAIPRRVAFVASAIPRWISACNSPPVLAYSDASGACRIGCVVFVDGIRTMAHTHMPGRIRALPPGIFEYELFGDIFALSMSLALAPRRKVLL